MVEWTEAERRAIESVWEKIDINVIGPQALERYLDYITQKHVLVFPAVLLLNAAGVDNAAIYFKRI